MCLKCLYVPFEVFNRAMLFVHCCVCTNKLHQLAQQDVVTTCFYQGFPGIWQYLLEGFCKSLKYRFNPCVYLNHRMYGKYVICKELYFILSKYVDEFLVAGV